MPGEVKMDTRSSLIGELKALEAFRLGEFTLKNGFRSPIYIDCRLIISNMKVKKATIDAFVDCIRQSGVQFDYIVGVPDGAVPYANSLSDRLDVPLLLCRKQVKDYGTKKPIEGAYEAGQRVVVVEDVITTGSSIVNTVEVLRAAGLVVTDVLVLLDRQQGAEVAFKRAGLTAHRVLLMDDVLKYLVDQKEITKERVGEIKGVLAQGSLTNADLDKKQQAKSLSLRTRLELNGAEMHPCARKLVEIMLKKTSNLCVAADFTSADKVLELAQKIGPHIALLKLHADILQDASAGFFDRLRQCANQNEFMLFEDRKLADTGTTVQDQLHGPFNIVGWADFVTVHAVPGPAVLHGFKQAVSASGRSVAALIVAEMSCKDALTKLPSYTKDSVSLGEQFSDQVAGFICQQRCTKQPAMLCMTPGVHLAQSGDAHGQQFRSPVQAISVDANDLVIVGRGVTKAEQPEKAAAEYKEAAWQALLDRDAETLTQ